MKIAVFCGSGHGNKPAYREMAGALGRLIAGKGHVLIYGGGEAGLMGEVAGAAHALGGEVIGVVPKDVDFIRSRPQPYVTKLVTTENMSSRKQYMLDEADAFIALPGGIGTLDEISEVITLTKIGVFDKKSVLVNVGGFYEPFRQMIGVMDQADFLAWDEMKHVLFSEDLEEIEAFLED